MILAHARSASDAIDNGDLESVSAALLCLEGLIQRGRARLVQLASDELNSSCADDATLEARRAAAERVKLVLHSFTHSRLFDTPTGGDKVSTPSLLSQLSNITSSPENSQASDCIGKEGGFIGRSTYPERFRSEVQASRPFEKDAATLDHIGKEAQLEQPVADHHKQYSLAAMPYSIEAAAGLQVSWCNLVGGKTIEEHAEASQKLRWKIDAALSQDETFEQDICYQGTGLSKLLQDAAHIKLVYDSVCQELVAYWKTHLGLPCRFRSAPVKSLQRSQVKVRVAYNGKATLLKDAVRGTIELIGEVTQDAFTNVYQALKYMVDNIAKLVPGAKVQVIRFKDRYQKPSGSYRDWQFFLRLNGFVCELQVNFSQALKLKEATDHKDYELERMAEDILLESAMEGNMTRMQLMIKAGVNVCITDSVMCTPLHYAAAYADEELCNKLIQQRADILAMDCSGALPLHRALKQEARGFAVANILIDKLLKCGITDFSLHLQASFMSAWSMMLVADNSQAWVAELAKRTEALVHNASGSMNVWPAIAAYNGDVVACQRLIELGVYQNCRYVEPQSALQAWPLDFAVVAGSSELVELLIRSKAFFYDEGPHCDLRAIAEQYTADNKDASLEALLTALKLGSSVGGRGRGNDPEQSVVEVLNVGCQWREWLEPLLELAAARNADRTLQVLLRNNAKFSNNSAPAENSLLRAAVQGNYAMMEMLLEVGVSANAVNKSGRSALTLAADQGQVRSCKQLLENKADVDQWCSHKFRNPIHAAADRGRIEVVKLLHKWNADLEAKNSESMTPAETAAYFHWQEVEELICRLVGEGK